MKPRVSVLHAVTTRLAGLTAMLLLLAASLFATPARADEASLFALLKQPGHVLLMRHTLAPGIGDPEGFVLEDCRTQRNLSDTGQVQARELGERLRAGGIESARVYSSRWRRCLDTATGLGLGPVIPLTALDSVFQRRHETEARTRALRDFLAALEPGEPVILVTHQMNVRALTGRSTGVGEGLLLNVEDPEDVRVVGVF
ncbi:histidine phosphatase family protein [Thioalkalivibrio sulfidiphilus]|uniref:histidine phosphatase family protein n=1 Tax=Thioalkalivibrio sulfidiphilus TaxID=1033854 RepID=UPI003B39ADA9